MLVITTPTGQIGSQVLDLVLDADRPVRVIARDPSRLPARVRERVEVVQGAADDTGVVTKAFEGADRVLWVAPPNPRAESLHGHVMDFTRPVCDAIEAQGVQRVVGVSSLGRGTARNAGQISAVFAMDALIESTGVHYRSLCAPGFMENMLRQVEPLRSEGVFFSSVSGDRKVPTCATRDIAAVAAGLLLDASWEGQEDVPLLGPEDLSHDDMAQIMTEVLERPVRYQQISGEAHRAALVRHGMSEAWARGIVAMADAADRGLYNAQPRTPQATTPTGFRQWCREVLKPAVGA
ncbi:NAD(P)H-binding protein [Actinomadura sp. WMMA1423]|uniref:NAD(P)H-binding protein n=1 Tax=Actinomadura sp. WMMA1423 TaxID=2591108 RepID=UPI00114749A1|nr:NAD(P)H-binding protein [Actinomadura sp. WMMA1423]